MADLYLVTIEHIDDGMWFHDPQGFDSEREAMDLINRMGDAPKGCCFAVYECRMLSTHGIPVGSASKD